MINPNKLRLKIITKNKILLMNKLKIALFGYDAYTGQIPRYREAVIDLGHELTFENPDLDKFRCIVLAYDSMKSGGTCTAILNIANDICVDLFLNKKIKFIDIPQIIESCIEKHDYINNPSLEDILGQIDWVKNYINKRTTNK